MKVDILDDAVEVRPSRQAHNPLLVATGFVDGETAVPQLDQRKLWMVISYDQHRAPPNAA